MAHKRLFAWVGVLVLVLAACGPAATPTPAPTATPRPTTAPMATPTPTATTPPPTPTPGPQYGGTLNLPLRNDPTAWDPHATHVDATAKTTAMVFSPLAITNPLPEKPCENVLRPYLADSWEWVGDTTLEVKLHKGVKFHNKPPVNGREVVAQDVVYSFNRIKEMLPIAQPTMSHVTNIEAVDNYTVRFHTDVPFPSLMPEFLGMSRGAYVLPQEAAVDGKYEDPGRTHIGTGPFVFQQYMPGVKVSYGRNDSFFKSGLPYVDGVEYLIVPDMSTRLANLRAGKLDLVGEVPGTQVLDLQRTDSQLKILNCPGNNPEHVYMRTDQPPFDDVRVRRAVAMAINRQGMIDAIFQGLGHYYPVVPDFFPTGMAVEDLPPEVRKYAEYHPDEARQLLQEAYPQGVSFTLRGTPKYPSPYPELIQALAADLEAVGFTVKIDMQEYGAWTKTTLKGDFPTMALTHGRIESETYAKGYLWALSTGKGSVNRSHVNDPELDKLIDQWITTLDDTKRPQIARDLQIRNVEMAYRALLPAPDNFLVYRPVLRDISWRPSERIISPWLEAVWIQP